MNKTMNIKLTPPVRGNRLTPGNYFIELAFRREVTEETLRRVLVAMGFSNIEMDKNDDVIGALSLKSSYTKLPTTSTTTLAAASTVKAPTTTAPVKSIYASLSPTPLATPSLPSTPTGSSPQYATNVIPLTNPTANQPTAYLPKAQAPALLGTPSLPSTPTGSSQQYSMQPAPSQLLDTPLVPKAPTGSSPQYTVDAPMAATPSSLLGTPAKPGIPGGAAASTTTNPEATPADDATSSYGGGGYGDANASQPNDYPPAGGGGGDQTPGPNDASPTADTYQPQPLPDYQPPPAETFQGDATPADYGNQQDMTVTPAGGSEVAVVSQLTRDMANAQPIPVATRWQRWVEWGSPFATAPTHLASVSGEEEDTITRYRFVATLSRSFVATNAEDMSWVFIRRLAINPFADLSFQLQPFKLAREGLYEFRFFSRLKSNPTKDSVKNTLSSMGFSPMKLSLLKKNMRIPRRNSTVSLWLGIGRWSAPNSIVTSEDPFFFETLKAVQP